MLINTMLSSDSNLDQLNTFMENEYMSIIGGCAFILTIIILTTYFGCCWNGTGNGGNITQDGNQNSLMAYWRTTGCCGEDSSVVLHAVTPNTHSTQALDNRQVPMQTTDRDQYPNHTRQTGVNDHSSFVITNNRQDSRASISPTSQTRSREMAALPKPRGLSNNGNTCYFNSVLQALAHTFILQTQLGKISECGDIMKALTRFYTAINGSETSAYNPHRLQRQLFNRTGKFDFGLQHDSHECLLNILHELRNDERKRGTEQLTVVDKIFGGHFMTVYQCESCCTPMHLCEPFLDISLPICSSNAWESRRGSAKRSHSGAPYMPNRSITPVECDDGETGIDKDIESGNKNVRHNRLKRKKPDDRSRDRSTASKIRKTDSSQDDSTYPTPRLTLRVISAAQDPILDQKEAYKRAVSCMMSPLSNGNLYTIGDCLRRYTRKENIIDEYMCRECNNQPQVDSEFLLTSATKQTVIFNPPAVLTIHLKRFENKSGEFVKRNTMVRYDEVLDIGPYCSAWCWRNIPPTQNIRYSLYAVVVHSGSLQSGHYIAYVKVREYDQKIKRFLQKEYLNRDDITAEYLVRHMKNLRADEEPRCTEYPGNKEGIWYCMNDTAVSRVSLQDVLNQRAFLLFYERL